MRPPRANAPTVLIGIRVTEEERDRLREAAKANFQNVSDFLRDAGACAADETLEDDQGSPSSEHSS